MKHPTIEELHQFAAGKLDEKRFEEVAEHVEACEQCSSELEKASVFPDLMASDATILQSIARELPAVPCVILCEDDGSARGIVRPNSPEMPQGTHGRYQIQGEIARGGMGAILKGRDIDLGRDLAIKVLLADHKKKPAVLNRFVEEAQIGGQLQHPGIVPVYELGQFDDERPFFTMKLVKGETLAAILTNRKNPEEDRAKLLGIFEQICQTVAYAHSKGVIHRDLKPSNVMVGTFGEVQVMDWGLAKVLQKGGVADEKKSELENNTVIRTLRSEGSDTMGGSGSDTHHGSVMGTPAYMCPEQALGEVDRLDERADVFALGSILCELLTGSPTYTGNDSQEVYRKAARGSLDEAYGRLDDIAGHDAIVALCKNCLGVEPKQRLRDAGVVADAVANHLESVDQRLRQAEIDRVAERGRRRLTTAIAAAVLLATLIGGGSWFAIQSQKQAALTKENQERLQLNQTLEAKLENAGKLLESSFLNPETESEVLRRARDLTKETEALSVQKLASKENQQRTEMLVAQLTRRESNTQLVLDLQKAHETTDGPMTDYHWLGWTGSAKQYEEIFGRFGVVVGEDVAATVALIRESPSAVREACLDGFEDWRRIEQDRKTKRWIANVLVQSDDDPWRRKFNSARGSIDYKLIQQLAADVVPADQPPAVLVALAYELQSEKEIRMFLERCHAQHPSDYRINTALCGSCLYAKPPQYDQAVSYATAMVAIKPTLGARANLARLLSKAERNREAEQVLCELVRLNPKNATALNYLGTFLARDGRYEEATGWFQSAVAAGSPNDQFAAPYRANLGVSLAELGKFEEAIHEFEIAQDIAPVDFSLEGLAKAYEGVGDLAEATATAMQAAETKTGAELKHALRVLGYYFEKSGKPELAKAEYEKAKVFGLTGPSLQRPPADPAVIYAAITSVLAEKDPKLSLEASDRDAETESVPTSEALSNGGLALHLLGRFSESESVQRDALISKRKAFGAHPIVANAHLNLGKTLQGQGKLDEAEENFREAVSLRQDLHGPQDRRTINAICHLTESLMLQAKDGEASKMFEESLAQYRKEYGPDHLLTTNLSRRFAWLGSDDVALPREVLVDPFEGKRNSSVMELASGRLLFAGKYKEHERFCRRLLPLVINTDDAATADRAAKAILLNPKIDPSLIDAASKLAKRAVELGPDQFAETPRYLNYFAFCRGLALYRTGQYEESESWFETAKELGRGELSSIANSFHAMAAHHQGRAQDAENHMVLAYLNLNPMLRSKAQWDSPNSPFLLLSAKIAMREAHQVLGTTPRFEGG